MRKKLLSLLLAVTLAAAPISGLTTAVAAPVQSPSLVLHYDFKDGAKDVTGNFDGVVSNAAVENGVATVTGQSDSYVEIPKEAVTGIADGDFSLSIWANAAEIGELTTLASIGKYYPGDWSVQREYAVIVLNGPVAGHNFGTKYAISVEGADPSKEIAIKTPRSEMLANGQWTNLTVTQEGNTIRMYVDGKLAGEQECALKLQDVLVDGSFVRIGSASIFRDDKSFAGQLDDIKLYSGALSQEEVQAEIDRKLNPNSESLVLHYDFADGAKDVAGSYDGTLSNAVVENGAATVVGSSDSYIELPKASMTDLAGEDFSLSVWMNAAEIGELTTLASIGKYYPGDWSVQREYAVIVLNGPGHHDFGTKYAISVAGAENEIAIKTPRSEMLANGRWTNLTVTQEGNVIRMYVDGKLAGEQECALGLQDVLVDGSFIRIGAAGIFREDKSFAGQLDDIKLFNKALSQEEVQAEVDNKEFGGAESPFVAAAKAALDLGDLSGVFLDLTLPTKGLYDTDITWASSNEALISTTGAVNPPATGSVEVTLTATISKDGSSATKEFVVTLVPAPVLSKDPILHYDFADGAKDVAGNYDGVLNNVTVRNGAAEFTGLGSKEKSYIDIPKAAFTDVQSNQTTITMWINPDDSRNLNTLLDLGKHHDGDWSDASSNAYALLIINTPTHGYGVKFCIKTAGQGESAVTSPVGIQPEISGWSHLAVTQNGSDVVVYLNGQAISSGSIAGKTIAAALADGTAYARLGAAITFDSDSSFKGRIADFRIYEAALSAGEVAAEMIGQKAELEKTDLTYAYDNLDLGDTSDVKKNLTLATEGLAGTAISWKSSNEQFVAVDGTVTLPTEEQGDQTVILTATITRGNDSVEKQFTIGLKALKKIDLFNEDLAYARGYLDFILNDGQTELPDTAKNGSSITWSVKSGAAEIRDGVVYKTEGAQENEPLVLTAHVQNEYFSDSIDCENLVLKDEYVGQLMTYFSNLDDTRGMKLSYSYDGINFLPLNNGKSVVTATLGTKRLRDPALFRTKDGGFGMVSTQGWDNPYIYFFDTDLTEFTNERLLDAASTDGSTSGEQELTNLRAWAPEASYDPVTDQYYIYWSDPKTPYDDGITDRPIYYNTSKDLQTLSEPGAYFSIGRRVIDATIVKEDGIYYMFYKCEEGPTSCKIYMATSTSLEPGSFTTDWVIVSDPNGVVEGPAITRSLVDDKWLLYYDYFGLGANGGYGYSYTDTIADTSSWTHTYGASKTLAPSKVSGIDSRDNIVSHGGLISVTQKELDRAIAKWKVEPVLANVLDVTAPETVKAVEGDAFEALALPETVSVKVDDGGYRDVAVVWSSEGYSSAIGSYTLTGTLTLPANMKNTGNRTAQVAVSVEEKVLPPVDRTALGALITLAEEALQSTAYTQESLDALEAELEAARLVMQDDAATQEAVNAAAQALETAYQGLKLNLATELLVMSVELSRKTIEDYDLTQDSIDMLQAVIDEAEALLKDSTATQKQIDAMYRKVMKTLAMVVEREDRTLLSAAIDAAQENLTESQYTPASWAVLADALAKALEVEANDYATREEIDAAYQSLMDAMIALDLRANKAALESAVKLAQTLVESGNYSEESLRYVTELLDDAEAMMANADAVQADVDQMAADLTVAMARVGLAQKLFDAQALNAKDYTESSWNGLLAAMKSAEAVLADETAEKAALTEQTELLSAAVSSLVKAEPEPDKKPSKGSVSKTSENDYWDGVIEKIENASEGDTINVKLEDGAMMPATVLDRAKAKGVKLNVTVKDQDYLITEIKTDAAAVYYSAAELTAMAGEKPAKPETTPAGGSQAEAANPETGGEVPAAVAPTAPEAAAPVEPAAPEAPAVIEPAAPAEAQAEAGMPVWVIVVAAIAAAVVVGGGVLLVVRRRNDN